MARIAIALLLLAHSAAGASGSAPQDDVEKLGAVWKSNFGRPIDAMLSP